MKLRPPRTTKKATQEPEETAEDEKDEKTGGKKKKKEERTFKAMKMSQSLSQVSRGSRDKAMDKIMAKTVFSQFPFLECVQEAIGKEALKDLETLQPTPVQRLVFPALLNATKNYVDTEPLQTYLIAAETGSGKTLAYTLPMLDFLKREEVALAEKKTEDEKNGKVQYDNHPNVVDLEIPLVGNENPNGTPRAVILVPTTELVQQVGTLLKSLSHVVKFKCALISREFTATVIRSRLYKSAPDVVVCTPHLLKSLTETDPNLLSKCTQIIVDEADSLLDRSFSPMTTAIIQQATPLRRLVLCSATIPRSLDTKLRDQFPDINRLVTPNLHAIPRRVQLHVLDIDTELYKGNRKLACADALYTISKEDKEPGYLRRVLVFVNERKTAPELTEYLKSKDIDAVELDRDAADRNEANLLEMFTGSKQGVEPTTTGRERMKVLVTTDISSRGIDTKTVKNVILYDVPHTSVDFIHRVGRTGRMGRRGQAVVLVDRHTNKEWIKDLKTCALPT